MRLPILRILFILIFLPLLGCTKKPAEPLVKPGTYQGTPEELKRLWTDVLTACKRDDRARVHDLMSSFVMTREELQSLIGEAQAGALWQRYLAMLGSLVNAGAVELVAHVYEKKYDDIAVSRIDVLPDAEKTDTDRNVALALAKGGGPRPFYTVRVKRKNETRGLRYDFFIYINGYWRSGNLIGKFLPPAAPPAPPPAPSPEAANPPQPPTTETAAQATPAQP